MKKEKPKRQTVKRPGGRKPTGPGQQIERRVEDVIRKRYSRLLLREDLYRALGQLGMILIVLLVVFTQFFGLVRVSGNAMYPAMQDGDLTVIARYDRTYRSGDDVVVYTAQVDGQNRRLVGRIAAVEGDTVNVNEQGVVEVNGISQTSEIVFRTDPGEALAYPYKVQKGEVIVLGDHRPEAVDSRQVGPVPIRKIQGKVLSLFRRRGL